MRNFCLMLFAFFSLHVSATVHADFTADKFSGCPPLLVNFSNSSQPSNLTWSWNFGNSNTSTLANPSAVFNTPGVYQVKLIVSNGTEIDSVIKTVTVFHLPQVDFHAQSVQICQNDTVHLFSDVVVGDGAIVDYGWGFGDGVASSSINPSHVYNQSGSYNATLVVQDANGCSANKSKNAYIQVITAPVAAFTASPSSSCNASQSVSFTNSSTGSGLTYFWNLDNGVTSTLSNPTHVYVQEKRNVMLVATNSNGCSDTAYQMIRVGEVVPNFTSKIKGCTGEEIVFTNTSNVGGTSYWDFGDGTTSTSVSPIKIYRTPGVYTVKLIQTDGPCSGTIVKTNYITITQGFSVSFSMSDPTGGCASNTASVVNFNNTTPNAASFYWNFGDGGTSSLANPSHAYNGNAGYVGFVIVTDANGCSIKATFSRQISSYAPVPSFRADTMSCPGGAVHFHSSSLNASSYKWFFGDGDSGSYASPTHFYANPGNYTVTMIASNYGGCDSSLTKVNYIHVIPVVTSFTVDKTFSPCPPFVTVFTSTASRSDLAYSWDFGDGTTDTAANPTHIYFHPGVFTVKMITTTSNGCVDTFVRPNLIEVQGPVGSFSAIPTSGCVPLVVDFNATISSNTDKLWCDLGDGTLISDLLNFSHTYLNADTFHPKFILVDHVGCAVPYDLPPIITHQVPELNLHDTLVCQGVTVPVMLGNDKYLWEPSQFLSCDTCADVNIVPQTTISYKITATNQFGCQTVKSMTVHSDSLPVLVPPSEVKVCKNSSINLFVGEAHSISWSPATYLNNAAIFHPVCTPLQSTQYTATAANSLGCSVQTKIMVDVINKIKLNDIIDTTICSADPFTINTVLTVSPDADIKYTWTPPSLGIPTDVANPLISGLDRTTNIQVIASSGTCVPDTSAFTVTVISLPDMESSESVTTTPYAEVPLYASSHQELSYEWSSNDSLSCRNCRRTNLYPSQSQLVYVTGTNSAGCKTTDSINVNVLKCDPNAIFLPNIFTPNNDGLNDRFMIRSKVLANLSYFRIFDQWGQLVFETKDINEGWDGTIRGKKAPVAVYVCMLGGQCENGADVTKSSNITLIR